MLTSVFVQIMASQPPINYQKMQLTKYHNNPDSHLVTIAISNYCYYCPVHTYAYTQHTYTTNSKLQCYLISFLIQPHSCTIPANCVPVMIVTPSPHLQQDHNYSIVSLVIEHGQVIALFQGSMYNKTSYDILVCMDIIF